MDWPLPFPLLITVALLALVLALPRPTASVKCMVKETESFRLTLLAIGMVWLTWVLLWSIFPAR